MKIKTTYKYIERLKNHSVVKLCDKVIMLVDRIYSLPNNINIEFVEMPDNTYGMTMLDPRYHNTIRLNSTLGYNEMVIPLSHELLHIHQMHTGSLRIGRKNEIIYENVVYKVNYNSLDYKGYTELPWETDVVIKQHKLLSFIEKSISKNS